MNLTEQFPDVSAKNRARTRMENRRYKAANASRPLTYAEDQAVIEYYEGGFRKWHLKFVCIVAVTIGVLFYFILKSFWIIQWVIGQAGFS